MAKLFALEDSDNNTSNSNELLIDKVIRQHEEPKSPINLTADILKQRNQLKEEISKELEKAPEPSNTEENTEDNTDDSSSNTEDNDIESKEDKTSSNDNQEEAEDKDQLQSLIGSDLKNDTSDKKEEPATESFNPRITLSNLFTPIERHQQYYRLSLEAYNLSNEALPVDQQPIVYVKEAVIESLNNLIKLSNTYIDNNTNFVKNIASSVKNLNERLTVFQQFVDNQKYHFTNKLVNDKEILSTLGCPNKSDLRETLRILLKYIDKSQNAISLVTTNDFNTIKSSFTNNEFTLNNTDYDYKETLPGFNVIRVHIEDYKNYLTTKIQENQYYRLKTLKTEDLFNLDAITINEDKELVFILSGLNKLLVNISLSVDNLTSINEQFNKFIDEIKVMIYDIEQDKYTNLANIKIDEKVKDFIKFKLAIECYYININTMIDYLTSVMSVINECVELKD